MAALAYGIGGLLLLAAVNNRWKQLVVVAIFAGLVFLTGSRTTISGFAAGLLWFFIIAKWPWLVRIGAAGFLVWVLQYAEENLARVGIFANREGTDWFRAQIAEGVSAKIALSPPQGMGLGEAYVTLPQGNFFFHSSYDTLLVEGGAVALVVVVGLTLALGVHPLRQGRANLQLRAVEAGAIAILVCSWQLGEVFMTLPWVLVVASGMHESLVLKTAKSAT